MALDVIGTNFQFNAVDRGPESMTFNVFNGRPGLSIFAGKARLFSQSFNLHSLCMLKKELKQVRDGQPGTTRTLIFQKWIPEEKKYNTQGSLIIGKDDKNVYYLELQFQNNGNHKSIRFNFRSPAGVVSSTDDSNPSISSAIALEAFIMWLTDFVPYLMNVTGKPFERNSRGGGQSYGGGSSSNGNDYSGADADFG